MKSLSSLTDVSIADDVVHMYHELNENDMRDQDTGDYTEIPTNLIRKYVRQSYRILYITRSLIHMP